MLPLPVPERCGSLKTLKPVVNFSNENEFLLIIAWLLAALRPGGPYPLLAISGQQGSAKTVLWKELRRWSIAMWPPTTTALGSKRVDNFYKRELIEVSISGANAADAVLAHENRSVRVVNEIAAKVRHLPDDLGCDVRMLWCRHENRKTWRGE
jgi:hypothetical protein